MKMVDVEANKAHCCCKKGAMHDSTLWVSVFGIATNIMFDTDIYYMKVSNNGVSYFLVLIPLRSSDTESR